MSVCRYRIFTGSLVDFKSYVWEFSNIEYTTCFLTCTRVTPLAWLKSFGRTRHGRWYVFKKTNVRVHTCNFMARRPRFFRSGELILIGRFYFRNFRDCQHYSHSLWLQKQYTKYVCLREKCAFVLLFVKIFKIELVPIYSKFPETPYFTWSTFR